MAERRIIVDHLKLSYEGLFNATELYALIDDFFREKGYDKREVKNEEQVTPNGKYVDLVLQPWKKITDYIRHIIRVDIKMFHLTEVEVEKDGHKVKLHKGRVNITFDGFLDSDYEHRWDQKPFYFFIRTIFDKFIYKSYMEEYAGILVDNINQLNKTIKAFLNLYRY